MCFQANVNAVHAQLRCLLFLAVNCEAVVSKLNTKFIHTFHSRAKSTHDGITTISKYQIRVNTSICFHLPIPAMYSPATFSTLNSKHINESC